MDAELRWRASMMLIVSASLGAASSLCAAAGSPLMAPAVYRSLMNLIEELQNI